ncbi:MAG: hypothetical protein PHO55_07445 [Thiomonas arsenitoxydans]|nr:hypothetical protein [Thiomonas arsenitoxydans]CQR41713.1 hypothetical protein THICB3110282 [Thiomonas sp. CB3]
MSPQENRSSLEYKQHLRGDSITGTREQLLDLGIGVGQRYPGEPGAAKWITHVNDPRGFDVRLVRHEDLSGRFTASVYFPGWPQEPSECGPVEPYSDGVTRQAHYSWGDAYVGSQEALVAAGLVAPDQFPGMPGRLKTCVTIYPSGEVPTSRMGAHSDLARLPGAKSVERFSRGRYRVLVKVPEEVCKTRNEAHQRAKTRWIDAVLAMPRPAPLFDLDLLSRQRGRCVAFSPPRDTSSGNVVSLAAWRARRAG